MVYAKTSAVSALPLGPSVEYRATYHCGRVLELLPSCIVRSAYDTNKIQDDF
jgi:hypothetical protein